MNETEMKQALLEESKKRCAECMKEIQVSLEKFNCTIDVTTVIKSNQNPEIRIEVISK